MAEKNKSISTFTLMSRTGRQLQRWEKESLITYEQLATILSFEKKNQGKRWMRSLMGLALFAIVLGVLSIIAANWIQISGSAKIAAHFLLNIVVAGVLWRANEQGNKLWREGATLVFLGLNLTLIVLIGQVFQLSGNYAAALALWMGISTPAVFLYGRTSVTAAPWAMALLATIVCLLIELEKIVPYFSGFLIFLATVLFVPLLLMMAGNNSWLSEKREAWATTFFRMGTVILVILGTVSSMSWYVNLRHELYGLLESAGSYGMGYTLILAVCIAPVLAVYGYEWVKRQRGEESTDRFDTIFVMGSLISMILPLILMAPEMEFVAVLHFIAYWGFLGWIGHRLGYEQLVSWAISLITLRLIIVYIELFGGLLTTGIGLIGSGVLLLVVLRIAGMVKKQIKGTMLSEGGKDE